MGMGPAAWRGMTADLPQPLEPMATRTEPPPLPAHLAVPQTVSAATSLGALPPAQAMVLVEPPRRMPLALRLTVALLSLPLTVGMAALVLLVLNWTLAR